MHVTSGESLWKVPKWFGASRHPWNTYDTAIKFINTIIIDKKPSRTRNAGWLFTISFKTPIFLLSHSHEVDIPGRKAPNKLHVNSLNSNLRLNDSSLKSIRDRAAHQKLFRTDFPHKKMPH